MFLVGQELRGKETLGALEATQAAEAAAAVLVPLVEIQQRLVVAV
jgi:hypothetical protein